MQGLYTGSAACHPGGGVTCCPGAGVTNAVLADLGKPVYHFVRDLCGTR
jgi:phytoene dehydrogenase-like protein